MGEPYTAPSQYAVGHDQFQAGRDLIISFPLPKVDADDLRLLRQLADKIGRFWIDGILNNSVSDIDLQLEAQPKLIDHPMSRIQELPPQPRESLSRAIEQTYSSSLALLILGEPGAGKTVLMLQLAKALLKRFETDPTVALPVVLNLSTWRNSFSTLDKWIERQFSELYEVQASHTRRWLRDKRIVLLLDGLDESGVTRRHTCVQSINRFLKTTGVPGVVVCSRKSEYEDLQERLKFRSAVSIKKLSLEQIDTHLDGSATSSVSEAIRQYPTIQELARSPLMLPIIRVAYEGVPLEEIKRNSDADFQEVRKHIFGRFVDRMFERVPSTRKDQTRELVLKWFSWLAKTMRSEPVSFFALENLQPTWLSSRRQLWAYALFSRIAFCLIYISAPILAGLALSPELRGEIFQAVLYTLFTALPLGALLGTTNVLRLQWTRGSQFVPTVSAFFDILLCPIIFSIAVFLLLETHWLSGREFFLGTPIGLGELNGWHLAFAVGLRYGSILGILSGVRTILRRGAKREIRLSSIPIFSFRHAFRAARTGATVGAICSLPVSSIIVVIVLVSVPAARTMSLEDVFGIICMFLCDAFVFSLIAAVIGASLSLFSQKDLPRHSRPGQGVIVSSQKALLAAFCVTAAFTILAYVDLGVMNYLDQALMHGAPPELQPLWVPWHKVVENVNANIDPVSSVCSAIFWGIVFFFWYRGFDIIEHVVLRLVLWQFGCLPARVVPFLDYMCRLIFLQKAGSAYLLHIEFRDYFADLL
jgi:NACHT domain